jgi:hypothetical protein
MRLSNTHAALLSWSGAVVAMGIPFIVCHLVLLWSIPSVAAFSAVSSPSSPSSIASSSRWLVLYDQHHHHHYHHSGSGGPRFITRLQDSTEAPSDSASLDDTDDDSDYRAKGYGTTSAATTENNNNPDDDDTNRHPNSRRASMISQIFDLLPPQLSTIGGGGSSNNFFSFLDSNSHANEQQRATINEAIFQLEALGSSSSGSGGSTTTPVTSSPLLNGVWELKYVGGYTMDGALPSPTRQLALFLYSGGYSPGVRILLCVMVCACVLLLWDGGV